MRRPVTIPTPAAVDYPCSDGRPMAEARLPEADVLDLTNPPVSDNVAPRTNGATTPCPSASCDRHRHTGYQRTAAFHGESQ